MIVNLVQNMQRFDCSVPQIVRQFIVQFRKYFSQDDHADEQISFCKFNAKNLLRAQGNSRSSSGISRSSDYSEQDIEQNIND